jgi:site-specific recombinase XerD
MAALLQIGTKMYNQKTLNTNDRRYTMNKKKSNELGIALRGFFCDYLPQLKGMSPHTIHSYRDSLKIMLLFLSRDNGSVDSLCFGDMTVNRIEAFLNHLETQRHNSTGTRNIRLSAVHSFFRYVATTFPEYLHLSQQILSVPFKRMRTRAIEYLEFEELEAVLDKVDRSKPDGRRDYALFTIMFNTGGRVQEIVDLKANDLQLSSPFSIHIFGKGRKERICPIWAKTAHVLHEYVEERGIDHRKPVTLFTNHLGTPLTRFGVRYILAKYIRKAAENHPSLKAKRLHPHSMRHSTAVYLLKSGVDLVSIANWLGHASTNTTNKYATVDLDMKREAIAKAAPPHAESVSHSLWRKNPDILAWLESL